MSQSLKQLVSGSIWIQSEFTVNSYMSKNHQLSDTFLIQFDLNSSWIHIHISVWNNSDLNLIWIHIYCHSLNHQLSDTSWIHIHCKCLKQFRSGSTLMSVSKTLIIWFILDPYLLSFIETIWSESDSFWIHINCLIQSGSIFIVIHWNTHCLIHFGSIWNSYMSKNTSFLHISGNHQFLKHLGSTFIVSY